MAEFQIGGKPLFTQTGTDNPVMDSGVNVDSTLVGATFPAGHIIQVQSTTVTDRNSSNVTATSGLGGDVGLNVTITPKSSNSKFFINVTVGIGSDSGGSWAIILSRDGTRVGNGFGSGASNHWGVFFRGGANWNGDSNHGFGGSGTYIDETSGVVGTPILYKAGLVAQTAPAYINQGSNDYSGTAYTAASYSQSTITVMEIMK